MKSILRLLFALFLLPLGSAMPSNAPQQQRQQECELTNTSIPFEHLPVRMAAPLLAWLPEKLHNHSDGEVEIQNIGPTSLQSIFFIFEYYGPQNETLFQMAFAAGVDPEVDLTTAPVRPLRVDKWDSALRPGSTVRIYAVSDFIFSQCPSGARVTFLFVRYENGHENKWSMPDWRMSPIWDDLPYSVTLKLPATQLPFSDYMTLKIDAHGTVTDLEADRPDADQVAREVSEKMRDWTFFPALDHGQPVPSKIRVLVRICRDPSEVHVLDASQVSSPLVDLLLLKGNHHPNQWVIYFGERVPGGPG